MSTYDRRRILLATGGTVFAGLAGCLGAENGDDPGGDDGGQNDGTGDDREPDPPGEIDRATLVRTDERGGIAFEVLFANPLIEADPDGYGWDDEAADALVFEVEMDAHSGDLTTTDWAERATLRTKDGKSVDDLEWVWERESAHHPRGYYQVDGPGPDGEPIVDDETEAIELVIRVVDEETATFAWELDDYSDPGPISEPALYAYVTNAYDGTVSVIDHDAGAVAETIDVADQASHGIAVRPDGETLFVGDYGDGNVYAIGTDDFDIRETIATGSNAHGVDLDPDGRYLYVSGGSVDVRGDVAVVDAGSYDVLEGIETDGAGHVNFGPDGRYAYVSNVDMDRIAVVDVDAMAVLETVPVGEGPNEAVASPDGRYVYTANVRDGSVSVVEVETWEERDRIAAGEGTHGIDVTPDGTQVWTANRGTGDLSVIDVEKREVVETVTDVDGANHLAITPDGSAIYVTAPGSDEAVVVDPGAFEVVDRIDVGAEPHEIAFATLV